jgi:hypothetical protein
MKEWKRWKGNKYPNWTTNTIVYEKVILNVKPEDRKY